MGCRCNAYDKRKTDKTEKKVFPLFLLLSSPDEYSGAGHSHKEVPSLPHRQQVDTNVPNLVKVEASLAHLDLVKVPGVAPWPWQFAPRAEGPWPRC